MDKRLRHTSAYWQRRQARRRKYERFRDLIRRRKEWRSMTPEQKESHRLHEKRVREMIEAYFQPFPHIEFTGRPIEWRKWNT